MKGLKLMFGVCQMLDGMSVSALHQAQPKDIFVVKRGSIVCGRLAEGVEKNCTNVFRGCRALP